MEDKRLYPAIQIEHIQDPNRWYAAPLFGGLVKILILTPVFLWIAILGIVWILISFINSFVVLFTGSYWDLAYRFTLGLTRLSVKVHFFFSGLSNRYPWFTLANPPDFSIDIPKPERPNRLFAIPVIGGLARLVLLIPYLFFSGVVEGAAWGGAILSSSVVLFKGRYPETSFELLRDNERLKYGYYFYFSGISDTYPSFWISMNHQTLKLLLIMASAALSFFR